MSDVQMLVTRIEALERAVADMRGTMMPPGAPGSWLLGIPQIHDVDGLDEINRLGREICNTIPDDDAGAAAA